jgi:hypothetical protein
MKTSSAKNKGRILQKSLREKLLEACSELTGADIVSRPMGSSGSDLIMSQKARDSVVGAAYECKNQERLNLWESWEQCKANANKEELPPVLVVKRNRSDILVITDIDTYLDKIL